MDDCFDGGMEMDEGKEKNDYMDGGMDGEMKKCMTIWLDGGMKKYTTIWMDGWMDEEIYIYMDGWID